MVALIAVAAALTVPLAALEPAWSPDGARIAFAQLGDSGAVDLYVVGADGGGGGEIPPDAREPVWSPDGARIVFVHAITTVSPPMFEYVVANADGSNPHTVATSAAET